MRAREQEAGAIRASPSYFDLTVLPLTGRFLLSESYSLRKEQVGPQRSCPSPHLQHLCLSLSWCEDHAVISWRSGSILELALLLDAGPQQSCVRIWEEDGTCYAGVGGSSRENSSLGSQMERGRSRIMLSHKKLDPWIQIIL